MRYWCVGPTYVRVDDPAKSFWKVGAGMATWSGFSRMAASGMVTGSPRWWVSVAASCWTSGACRMPRMRATGCGGTRVGGRRPVDGRGAIPKGRGCMLQGQGRGSWRQPEEAHGRGSTRCTPLELGIDDC